MPWTATYDDDPPDRLGQVSRPSKINPPDEAMPLYHLLDARALESLGIYVAQSL
jgi:hypothetical protein